MNITIICVKYKFDFETLNRSSHLILISHFISVYCCAFNRLSPSRFLLVLWLVVCIMSLGKELIERLGAGERGAALGEVAVVEGLRLPLKLAHVHARCLLHLLHHAVPESERL